MQGILRQPDAGELRLVISQVLESFAYISVTACDGPAPELPLNYKAAMPQVQGWLVLSGTRQLARELAEASMGSSCDGLDEDAFAELCNITASHLAARLKQGSEGRWSNFVPEAGLPMGRASAFQLLDVNGQALEISYWPAS